MIELKVRKTLLSHQGTMGLDVDLQIGKGDFVIIGGKSGAGKTSLLRMLAGLLNPDSGTIKVADKTWFDKSQKLNLSPQQRQLGFVFQDFALFPNMTVRQNLEYALKKEASTNIIDELIDMMELGELESRKPDTLSGGQKQRVALARSLVQKPKILLLDEPLSALDPEIRAKLQDYLSKIHKAFELTTIMVSHDITEAIKLADRIIELDNGSVAKSGTPAQLFGDVKLSGKFQFTGVVLTIESQDFLNILSLVVGKEVVRVAVDESEAKKLSPGDKVIVASKAFNPIIKKL
ncbi:ABC transporter ATP-binding protein [Roseivirga pacifica]|uniref:ABC transporter ATP-binding protein n=1 Tax=Roseivirga pacifica TaxID=1267423 RepID=UPI002094D3E9|nr:ABC transporter ATP-binding protein [Roseivirga pacifica]MCO6360758.1 ATP-binding cassette domain-containing protein [Roseivirga pacifica]MCO6368647.1 ATP-binding cassette domain-containing protein [Roseivirga pacifica]MCO6372790.1 ATP-binding cassette domain-containing protein [Roseivirga pacifica]MCO6376849.1 ATP-binding cassette domain-containing protein [Roseivirga pacifica]MCO6377873.1 ATP-binding cassette domain-containing protein [Roseivirga pacifica]